MYIDEDGRLHTRRRGRKIYIDDNDKPSGGMDLGAATMMLMILDGHASGRPEVGFMTNPDAKNRPHFIEVNGEKVVCLAQGGECRFNKKYYDLWGGGLNSAKSWVTPVIDETCPDECRWGKYLVCEGHPTEPECPQKRRFYPRYNKYRGEFEWYCQNYALLKVKQLKNEKADEVISIDPRVKRIKVTNEEVEKNDGKSDTRSQKIQKRNKFKFYA